MAVKITEPDLYHVIPQRTVIAYNYTPMSRAIISIHLSALNFGNEVGKAFIMTPSTWGLVLFAPQIVV
jgi:hypothetical protein